MAGALAGKENAAEDAAAMVAKGAQLQSECTGLERLGRQRVDGARGPPKDGERAAAACSSSSSGPGTRVAVRHVVVRPGRFARWPAAAFCSVLAAWPPHVRACPTSKSQPSILRHCCAALAAEKELLQLHPAAQGITPADLRAFQDLLARQ